jgi:hypothetical protein
MATVQALSRGDLKPYLCKRLKRAKKYRERLEPQWRLNEKTAYYHNSREPDGVTLTEDNLIRIDGTSTADTESTEMAVNYSWKFLRFIHSQMSTNPPSVVCRPTSSDPGDRNKADAADRIVRHAILDQDMPELFDQGNLKCLTYGTGWFRVMWDPDAGDTFEFDGDSGELTMAGDVRVYSPSTWDVWIDPDAKCWRDVRYVFERITMPLEEAKFRFQGEIEDIEKFVKTRGTDESELDDWQERDDVVEIFYYVEKALPINGMAGRMAFCLEDGTILGEPSKNTNPGEVLGFAIETDIDVPDQVYGKSFIEYVYKLQELLNRLDTNFVDNIAAHNVVRMVLPQGCEIEDESLSNSAWDYVTITGNAGNGPYYAPAASLMPDAHKLRENLISAIQELAGVNDSMMGVQKREMSGFSMQTAIDAGNQTRRRLFNKYTACVRDVYRMYLAQVRENWKDPRKILVLGKEKAFEAADLSGADIDGGFDIICEYGASLSLDPARRREEIMQLMPIFEKAGVPTKTVLTMLKLNELDGMYDRMGRAADRQREDFEEMIATGKYIEPKELQDHAGRLDYAYDWLESAEFKYLDDEAKGLIERHVLEREQYAAKAATKGQAGAPTAAPGLPATGQPIMPGVEMQAPVASAPAA